MVRAFAAQLTRTVAWMLAATGVGLSSGAAMAAAPAAGNAESAPSTAAPAATPSAPPAASPPARLPTIPPALYDAGQQRAAAAFLEARKSAVFGPFEPLMHSPELMTDARAMGDYLRYRSAVGNRLSEFVILLVAREWSQDYEWSVHAPIARTQGISPEVIAAIADARRPAGLSDDEAMCYEFSLELLRQKRVSDPTYQRVQKRFGDKGVADLIGINGYYTLLAMVLNTARTPVPAGAPRLSRMPD